MPIVFSMGAEIFPTNSRGQLLSLIASFWMTGAIFSALVGWIMLGNDFNDRKIIPHADWRSFAVVSALPVLLSFILVYKYLPESPRYLVFKGRLLEAVEVLQILSTHIPSDERDNYFEKISESHSVFEDELREDISRHSSSSPLHFEISRRHDSNISHQMESDTNNTSGTKSNQKTYFYNTLHTIHLLFGSEYLRTSLVLMTIWFTISFGSYGISTWITLLFADVGISNPYFASFIFALANLPGNIISLLFIDIVGRRWLLSIGMSLAGLSSIGFAMNTSEPMIVILFASLFNAFSVMGWNSLDCLASEAFPTSARTSAMGLLAASGRLGAMSGQFVNGILEENITLLLIVTSTCSIIGGLAVWALPKDTAGTSLVLDMEGEALDNDHE